MSKFVEIFATLCLSLFTGVKDTGDKLFTGVNDTGVKLSVVIKSCLRFSSIQGHWQ
jgi:hypothetical protein